MLAQSDREETLASRTSNSRLKADAKTWAIRAELLRDETVGD